MKFVTKKIKLFILVLSVISADTLIGSELPNLKDSMILVDVRAEKDLIKMPPPLSKTSVYMPVVWYNLESGSNCVPFSLLSKFAFGGYISPSEMNDYQSLLASQDNRMGAIQNYGINLYPLPGYEIQKKGALESIFLEIDDYTGAIFNQDAFRMIFQGNTNYLGKTLDVGNNVVESWRTRTLKFNFRKSFNKIEISPSIQVGQCLNYTRIETQNMKLSSDAVGDEITFSGNAYSANSGYSFWGTGVGMQAGLMVYLKNVYQSSKSIYAFSFGVKNFGFYHISDVNVTSRNAVWKSDKTGLTPESWNESPTFNLKAVQINSSDLQFGTWFDRQGDSIKSKLNFVETVRKGTVMAPFTLFAKLYITPHTFISGISKQELTLKYVSIAGYLPQLSYWATSRANVTSIKGNFKFSFSYLFGLSLGGFDTYDINAGLIFNSMKIKGKTVLATIKLTGIESYFAPSQLHGAGVSVHLNYPLYFVNN